MSTHITDESRFHSWEATPEPMKNERDPQTILDSNIDGQAWLYNSRNEETEWLIYDGVTLSVYE